MKRLFFGLIVTALLSVSQFGLASASTSDFTIKDFQADYYLDVDNSGRSTLKTVETITAGFPQIDQNHGIERALPLSYDGHITSLKIQSVNDASGAKLPYGTMRQNDNMVLRIGDPNEYVHGSQTYVITYTQRNVTRYFSDTKDDEFYWDVNGVGWSQTFDSVTARLHLSQDLVDKLNGSKSCYFGISGSTNLCTITSSKGVITSNVKNLSANENMTIAVGFNPDTFSKYKMTFSDFFEQYNIFISIAFSLLIIFVIWLLKKTVGKGAKGRGIIIAEYLPPKDVDVALSAVILKKPAVWTAATYIDLAVRHAIKIIEVGGEKSKDLTYKLEFVSSEGLTDAESDVIKALFGDLPTVGKQYEINKVNTDFNFAYKFSKIFSNSKKLAKSRGYFMKNYALIGIMIGLALLGLLQSVVLQLMYDSYAFYFGLVFAIFAGVLILTVRPLSESGRELLDYLKGLELYIKIAEEDRIKVLQSPQGADKTPIDTNDKEKLVKLYERVLPYAVLFGNEKQWSKVLGSYYEQQNMSPDWYVGNSMFNMIMFTSAISNFSQSASYSTSYNSTAGGSGGGGFSGGGGGGGGGGGW
jgi:uncharacterized membrane protein YgcG